MISLVLARNKLAQLFSPWVSSTRCLRPNHRVPFVPAISLLDLFHMVKRLSLRDKQADKWQQKCTSLFFLENRLKIHCCNAARGTLILASASRAAWVLSTSAGTASITQSSTQTLALLLPSLEGWMGPWLLSSLCLLSSPLASQDWGCIHQHLRPDRY